MGRTALRGNAVRVRLAVLRSLAALLARGVRHEQAPPTPQRVLPPRLVDRCRHQEAGLTRLVLPDSLPAELGCDAVGVPARFGFRLLGRMPRSGCVFADSQWWWWIVPAGSDLDLLWPLPAHYARGARVPGDRPRLIRGPNGPSPYTPPIPLYLTACQLTGAAPKWPTAVGSARGA
ncbi:hypothetical protein [Streptomyces sp. PKU-EA00015]|uniref:hypothetical protein n=1 Tax=Streptomyces sp. PKU-EA00015 TaxID=2748326 RepID=UPI002811E93F|nr:hypothetical protein [Streptomyces sp. PKU-EA00015]